MKSVIIYASYHHNNTRKIAEVIGEKLNAKFIPANQAAHTDITEADLIGFGSGIYYSRFHKSLLNFIKNLPVQENKKSFLFSTAGMKKNILFNRGHKSAKKILKNKGFKIIGEFDCPGYDTNSFLKAVGGINKGRPDRRDLENAENFAEEIKTAFSKNIL